MTELELWEAIQRRLDWHPGLTLADILEKYTDLASEKVVMRARNRVWRFSGSAEQRLASMIRYLEQSRAAMVRGRKRDLPPKRKIRKRDRKAERARLEAAANAARERQIEALARHLLKNGPMLVADVEAKFDLFSADYIDLGLFEIINSKSGFSVRATTIARMRYAT